MACCQAGVPPSDLDTKTWPCDGNLLLALAECLHKGRSWGVAGTQHPIRAVLDLSSIVFQSAKRRHAL